MALIYLNCYSLDKKIPLLTLSAELLNITRDTELEVTTDGTRLIVEPVREVKPKGRRTRVAAATKRIMKNHDRTLRWLAK